MTRTKKFKVVNIICHLLSFIILALPVIIYTISAFLADEVTVTMTRKVTLGCCVITSIVLSCINIMFKYKIRSTLWILVLGLSFALSDIQKLLVIMACSSIIEEFILTPIEKYTAQKYAINKEIDYRGNS